MVLTRVFSTTSIIYRTLICNPAIIRKAFTNGEGYSLPPKQNNNFVKTNGDQRFGLF